RQRKSRIHLQRPVEERNGLLQVLSSVIALQIPSPLFTELARPIRRVNFGVQNLCHVFAEGLLQLSQLLRRSLYLGGIDDEPFLRVAPRGGKRQALLVLDHHAAQQEIRSSSNFR